MGLFSKLFGKSNKTATGDTSAFEAEVNADLVEGLAERAEGARRVVQIDNSHSEANVSDTSPTDAPSIWDIADKADATEATPVAETPSSTEEMAPAPRRRRTKTRLIGFEPDGGQVVDLFGDTSDSNKGSRSVKFPVGWVAIVDGKGRGEVFAIHSGMSSIGRGDDQAVQLDFGDTSISRSNHAAIVYDTETNKFLLGHGGKSNVVRLNDAPLISNEILKTGDIIRLGETSLKFIALCNEDFNWEEKGLDSSNDVESA